MQILDRELTHLEDEEDNVDALLPEEVRLAYLPEYAVHQLEARRLHFEREALFERDTRMRKALSRQAERTVIELNRRKMYARAEAEKVFAL